MRNYAGLLCVLTLMLSCADALSAECAIQITTPPHKGIVLHNNEPSEEDSFMFTVKGTVTNLGSNSICIYQKVSSDSDDWWRSGKPITQDSLGPNGEWTSVYASCGRKSSPHPSCLVKAVVQTQCIDSGLTTEKIGEHLCSTAAYTFETKH